LCDDEWSGAGLPVQLRTAISRTLLQRAATTAQTLLQCAARARALSRLRTH
jgi:hypothetical protein